MSSPPPIDPYLALGISKDADVSAIRSAHRKLVLKFHPDRIKDEAERIKGREEFQKAQQAYELLTDPAKRARYDDKIKLAELRKESLSREYSTRSSPYSSRPPTFTATQEFRDGYYYEERVPVDTPFFHDEDRYTEEPIRSSARKGDNYERQTFAGLPERKSSGWKVGGIPIDIAMKWQAKGASARERVRERDRERDMRAATAKSRDQERRRDASDKHQNRRAYVEEDSDDDADTVTYSTVNPRAAKPSPPPATPGRTHTRKPGKESRYSDGEDEWGRDKFNSARDYIQRAASDRPRQMSRQDSSYSYFESRVDRPQPRRGETDRPEKQRDRERAKPSRSTKTSYSEVEVPRDMPSRKVPSMPKVTSAPAKIIIPQDRGDSGPRRSSTAHVNRDHRLDVPSMPRSNTTPLNASARRGDSAPHRGTNLKHAEALDSGYGSSSPATPDIGGTSPTKYNATRYQIVEPDEDYPRGHRTIRVEPDDVRRRAKSPSREHQRPTLSTSGTRSKAARAATAYSSRPSDDLPSSRPSMSRRESVRPSGQSRESAPVSRGGSGHRDRKHQHREVSSDEQEGSYGPRYPSEKVSAPRARPQETSGAPYYQRPSRDSYRDHDFYPGSRHRSDLRNPVTEADPSVH